MDRLVCYKCGHQWVYNGKMSVMVTCPDCHRTIKISRASQNGQGKLDDSTS